MSIMQTFRDGVPRQAQRDFWRQILKLANHLIWLGLLIIISYEYHEGHLDKATFFAVLFLWNYEFDRRGAVNGS